MFARSTTLSGDPTVLDAGVAYLRNDVMTMLDSIAGCVGLSMMIDRESGQCIATTSWESEIAMHDSDTELIPVRARLAQLIGGTPMVEEWEVAAMHRDHRTQHGTCCRVTWLRTDHADVDRGIDIYRHAILPQLEDMDGFCSASLMINREAGRACATASYDTRDALEASRDRAWAMRDTSVREAGVDVMDAAEYELVIAHLRVPELV